jgi:hypothetical protein
MNADLSTNQNNTGFTFLQHLFTNPLSGPNKVLSDNTKSIKRQGSTTTPKNSQSDKLQVPSTNSPRKDSTMKGNSPSVQKSPSGSKVVIQEKMTTTPSKEWSELTNASEANNIVPEDIPVNEEKVVEYEMHFPPLGAETEAPKPESEFSTEILSPTNIVATQIKEMVFLDIFTSC